ncbi:uncharacterized protein LOC110882559 [Helianthus annuus]|uniref:uncharacterized protein LOC110882559 n=1 Tax=Helianthus annuus TaxID=4232 RepID=UPI000B8FE5D2|nr:uncharacterized protein LOC110882559 [Helianthus annuus]
MGVQVLSYSDRWKWSADPAGMFSVKSVKRLLKEEEEVQGSSFILSWCKWVPAKVNIHAWRMEMDKVPTAEALTKRNIGITASLCPMCNSEEETVDHVFNTCIIAANVWNGVSVWCKIPNIFAFYLKDLLSILKTLTYRRRKRTRFKELF